MKRQRCPRPDKARFRDKRDALLGAKRQARSIIGRGELFAPLYGYVCVCGRWHLTRRAQWDGQENVLILEVPEQLQRWAQDTPAELPSWN